jgi:hypothetical protein
LVFNSSGLGIGGHTGSIVFIWIDCIHLYRLHLFISIAFIYIDCIYLDRLHLFENDCIYLKMIVFI